MQPLTIVPARAIGVMREIERFFEDYNRLENKEVLLEDSMGPEEARHVPNEALELYRRLRRGEVEWKN